MTSPILISSGAFPRRIPAESYSISKNHLMKVIYELGKLGYVETIRGRNGGIRLGKAPEPFEFLVARKISTLNE